MNRVLSFDATDEGWSRPLELRSWSLYVYGGETALEAEERCSEGLERFSRLDRLLTIGVARSDPCSHGRFLLRCGDENHRDVPWSRLAEEIRQCLNLHGVQSPEVVFDITSLELDAILYLIPHLLLLEPTSLHGLYLVPSEYAMKEKGLVLQSIQQPKGYVSFMPGLGGARQAHHYIIAGFDEGRAQRYIDAYDWGWEQLHGIIGDPAYVPDGVQSASNANRIWLERLESDCPTNVHRIEAAKPEMMRQFLIGELAEKGLLDIVPLGPKPMLLGVLFFYLGLAEKDRERVRILFDFPTPKAGCTVGVSKGFLFNCQELLK